MDVTWNYQNFPLESMLVQTESMMAYSLTHSFTLLKFQSSPETPWSQSSSRFQNYMTINLSRRLYSYSCLISTSGFGPLFRPVEILQFLVCWLIHQLFCPRSKHVPCPRSLPFECPLVSMWRHLLLATLPATWGQGPCRVLCRIHAQGWYGTEAQHILNNWKNKRMGAMGPGQGRKEGRKTVRLWWMILLCRWRLWGSERCKDPPEVSYPTSRRIQTRKRT